MMKKDSEGFNFWTSLIFMNLVSSPCLRRAWLACFGVWPMAAPITLCETARPRWRLSAGVIHIHNIFSGRPFASACPASFHFQLFLEHEHGKVAESDNPWHATTLEWQTPTRTHGNFDKAPQVHRVLTNTRPWPGKRLHSAKRASMIHLLDLGATRQRIWLSFSDFLTWKSLIHEKRARYRPLQRQGRHLALSASEVDALRRVILDYILLRVSAPENLWRTVG